MSSRGVVTGAKNPAASITAVKKQLIALTLAVGGGVVSAQTRLDLRTQTKSPDFSQTPSTFPVETGIALPAHCNPGQLFFLTSASSGSNLYGCVVRDAWVVQTGIPSGWTDDGIRITATGERNIAIGDTVLDPVAGIVTPRITMPAGTPVEIIGACQPAAQMYTPEPGEYILFLDSTNSCHLTMMDTSGSTTDLQAAAVAGMADPGANGIIKRTALNSTTPALAGVDYQAPIAGAPASWPAAFPPPAPTSSALGGVKSLTCSGTDKLAGIGTDGRLICGPDSTSSGGSSITTFGATFDGSGSAVAVNSVAYRRVEAPCTITGYSIVAADAPSGSLTIDVLKGQDGAALPASSIAGTAIPTLSSGNAIRSATLSGWDTAVAANDILGFKITGAGAVTWASIALYCQR